MTLTTKVRGLGLAQRDCGKIMGQLALEVAHAAKRKEIDPDDAADLYSLYYQTASGVKPNPAERSFRVNASKLRQIIKAADPELLKKVIKIQETLPDSERRPLYESIVAACRARCQHKRISEKQLLQLILK
jgi:hypothetical protein